jgi:hypothetical protein
MRGVEQHQVLEFPRAATTPGAATPVPAAHAASAG